MSKQTKTKGGESRSNMKGLGPWGTLYLILFLPNDR